MTSEAPGLAAGVALLFERPAAAETRIAGVASAARALADARERGASEIWFAMESGPPSEALSDDLVRAARAIPLHIVDPSRIDRPGLPLIRYDAPWPVTTAQVLKGTAKASDGIVSRLFNRPLSQRLSALLLRIPGIRPGHVTIVTAALGLIMFLAFLFEGKTGLVLGGLLFHVASVVDGVDGEIARATFRESRSGAALDTAVDMATNLLFYLGVTLSTTRLYGPLHAWAGGWCVLLGLIGILIVRTLAAKSGEPGSFDILKVHYRRRYPDGIPARIVEWLVAITSRDFFAFGNALIILAGGGAAVSFLLAGFTTLWVALILIAAPAILREHEAPADRAPVGLTAAE
ncbi:MAG: CDP-alcohol phosphatidyltransferase family protein [Allosphingosinicella sp.]